MEQATWDRMRELVPYTEYRNASSFIREGIELMLKQEEERRRGGRQSAAKGVTRSCTGAGSDRRPGNLGGSPMAVRPRRLTSSARPFDGTTGGEVIPAN
jgi:Arc/MetJ-type ribon-helix-helix transcriptional regulator